MIKIIPIKKTELDKKCAQVTDEYLNIIPPESFLTWHNFLFDDMPLSKKKARYKYLEADILKLKNLFKKRVILLNKIAQEEGYENYLKWRLHLGKIPKKKFDTFLNQNIDKFISLVLSEEIPIKVLMKREKDWNIFNTPYPLGNQWPKVKFGVPNELLKKIAKYDKRLKKYRNKIDIKLNDKEFYSFAYFNKEKSVAEIKIRSGPVGIYQALDFVHELGHALDQLEAKEKGKDPHKLPKYLQEYKAYRFAHKFIKSQISEEHQKIIRYNNLQMIAGTLFEVDIFTNDKQDFDKAYAKAINRCYPMTNQTKNPFYVLYKRFILRPIGELTSSMIETELYLKEAGKLDEKKEKTSPRNSLTS